MASKDVKWDITANCNLRCAHCSVAKKYFAAKSPELKIEQKLEIVDRLAEGGVTGLSLLGGEPMTLGRDLFAVIKRAVDKGIRVSMVSNGLLLKDREVDELIDSGIERVVISLEGATAHMHELVRGRGTFDRLVANIGNVTARIRERSADIKVGINTVLNRQNIGELDQMSELCLRLCVNEWTLLSLVGTGFAEDNMADLAITPEQEIAAAKQVAELCLATAASDLVISPLFVYPLVSDYLLEQFGLTLPAPRICCTATITLGFVGPEGNLYPCDRVCTEHFVGREIEGARIEPLSLLDHSFYDIWNSEYYLKMFSLIVREDTYENYSPCNRCWYLKTRACNPCPLYSLDGRVVIKPCAIVAEQLGDISKPRANSGTLDGVFAPGNWTQTTLEGGDARLPDAAHKVPVKARGMRSAERFDQLFLLNPYSGEFMSLGLLGRAIWEFADGSNTVETISARLKEAFGQVKGRLRPDVTDDELNAQVAGSTAGLLDELGSKGFITWG